MVIKWFQRKPLKDERVDGLIRTIDLLESICKNHENTIQRLLEETKKQKEDLLWLFNNTIRR